MDYTRYENVALLCRFYALQQRKIYPKGKPTELEIVLENAADCIEDLVTSHKIDEELFHDLFNL